MCWGLRVVDRSDAYDVITDPDLSGRTTNLRRAFALKLAAQVTYDSWYAYEDPEELAAAIKSGKFDPEGTMRDLLLQYSGSIDAETLKVLRDVGVGSPQLATVGVGVNTIQPPGVAPSATPQKRERGLFG